LTKAITSNESIKGKRAEVVDKIDERGGRIFFEGGYWNATSEEVIEEGEICEIVERQGLTIKVQSVKNEKKSPDT
ncbi:MAG TPA: NfeD family protein, partial [Balneolaceae bacterium]|nr:NfeD family protein [Balneolaceae bacterium]